VEEQDGGRRRGHILVVQFLRSLYGGGSTGVRNNNRLSLGVGQSRSMLVLKSSVEVGGKRPLQFAKVLARPRIIPALSSLSKGVFGNFDVFAPM
jgi:hypothetical protein